MLYIRTLTLVGALGAACATAATFDCNQVWSGPSPNNKLADCFTNTTHVVSTLTNSQHIGYLILAIIPLVLFILVFLCWPVVTTCRYCCNCCGSSKQRPGVTCCGGSEWDMKTDDERQAAYEPSSVRNTKIMAVLDAVLGLALLVVGAVGFGQMKSSFNGLFTELESVTAYVDAQAAGIRTLLTINTTTPPTLIPPLTDSIFQSVDNVTASISSQLSNGKTSIDPYEEDVYIVGLILVVFPTLLLLLTALFACGNVRRCAPCLSSLVHYIFYIPVAIGAAVVFVLAMVSTDVCGERSLFLDNNTAPGLVSLAAVPLCTANFPFQTVLTDVQSVITTQAGNVCGAMLDICDGSATYDPANPLKVFQCANLTNATADCPNFTAATAEQDALVLKSGAPVECVNGTTVLTPCTFTLCASYCNVTAVRDIAANGTTQLHYADNGQLAFDLYVQPLLNCDNVYVQALGPMTDCTPFAQSMYLIGASLLGFTVLLAVDMCVLWRGQKRFFKPNPAHHPPAVEEDQPTLQLPDIWS